MDNQDVFLILGTAIIIGTGLFLRRREKAGSATINNFTANIFGVLAISRQSILAYAKIVSPFFIFHSLILSFGLFYYVRREIYFGNYSEANQILPDGFFATLTKACITLASGTFRLEGFFAIMLLLWLWLAYRTIFRATPGPDLQFFRVWLFVPMVIFTGITAAYLIQHGATFKSYDAWYALPSYIAANATSVALVTYLEAYIINFLYDNHVKFASTESLKGFPAIFGLNCILAIGFLSKDFVTVLQQINRSKLIPDAHDGGLAKLLHISDILQKITAAVSICLIFVPFSVIRSGKSLRQSIRPSFTILLQKFDLMFSSFMILLAIDLAIALISQAKLYLSYRLSYSVILLFVISSGLSFFLFFYNLNVIRNIYEREISPEPP